MTKDHKYGEKISHTLQPYIPSLRSIYLSGNLFQCHCSLRWIQHVIENQERVGGFVVKDGAQVMMMVMMMMTMMLLLLLLLLLLEKVVAS